MNRAKRISLYWFFSGALMCLVLVFVAVTTLAFYRLLSVSSILDEISKQSLPQILIFNRISTEAAGLTLYTEQLASAENPPSLRLAEAEINRKLAEIALLLRQGDMDNFLLKQFEALNAELDELTALVTEKLTLSQTIDTAEQQIYETYKHSLVFSQGVAKIEGSKLSTWGMSFSKLISLTGQLLSETRLHEIRLLKHTIETEFNLLQDQHIATFSANARAKALRFNQQFEQLVLSDQGVIALKISQLRIQGRATGRGNFTEKLVSNFARILSFQASELNNRILQNSILNNEKIVQHINTIGGAVTVALILILLIGVSLQNRVITRLINLNRLVSARLEGETLAINVSGNDEVSDLANTFEHYALTIERQKRELSHQALSDGLTGIANRRAFDEEIIRQLRHARRFQKPLSIILIDVDYFKPYNDQYGHAKGDETLHLVATILNQSITRGTDLMARYGGEEFICILPNTDQSGAQNVANKLREAVALENIPHEFSQVAPHITVSQGIATVESGSSEVTPNQLLKLADIALYQAKGQGRDKVVVYDYNTH